MPPDLHWGTFGRCKKRSTLFRASDISKRRWLTFATSRLTDIELFPKDFNGKKKQASFDLIVILTKPKVSSDLMSLSKKTGAGNSIISIER